MKNKDFFSFFFVGVIRESPLRSVQMLAGILMALGCFFAGGFSSVHAQDVQEIIRTLDGQQEKIQTLMASFSQKRETSLAKEPLFSLGIIKFKRPDRVHFLYLQPEPMEMALDGKTIWIYYPGRSQAEKYSFSQSRKISQHLEPVMGIFQKTFGRLAEGYTLNYQGLEDERTYRFGLEPRAEEVRKFLSRVDLWMDKGSGAIKRFEMVEANRDRLTLQFKDLQINPPLTDEDLTIKIPASVRVQEQSLP